MNRARLLNDFPRAVMVGICLAIASNGFAQVERPTQADALEAAVQLFDEGDYVGAQHALGQIDADQLTDDQRTVLTHFVQRATMAVSMQEKADADHEAAVLAVSEGRLPDAKRLLQSVLDNRFTSRETRKAAEASLQSLTKDDTPPVDHADDANHSDTPADAPDIHDLSGQLRSMRAKVFTREADAALNAGRISDAERLYRLALENVPGFPEAERGLRRLGETEQVESGARSLLGRITERNRVAWQRTVATYRMLEIEVRDHVLNNRFGLAKQALLRAQQVVEGGKSAAEPVSRYEALLHDVQALARYTEDEERVYNEREVSRQREEARRENQERVRNINDNKRKRISALMSEALQHRKDRNLDRAVNVLRQVLAIDPNNDTARWMKEGLEDQNAYVKQRALRDDLRKQTQGVLIDADDAKIPWWQGLTYPKNWLDIISRPARIPPGSETPGIDDDLQSSLNTPIRIDFQNEPLGNVVQMLAKAANANISVAWNSLASASINRNTPVNLTFANPVKLGTAIREVLDNVNGSDVKLGYTVANSLVKVATQRVLDRTVVERVYDVNDLLMIIPDFDDAPNMNLDQNSRAIAKTKRRTVFDNGTIFFPEGDEDADESVIDEQANELVSLIRKTIEPESWRANNGDVGSITEINGQLVITQTPSTHARVGGLLSKLREQRAIQIAIEARFITVQSNYLEELGMDLDIVLNSGNAGFDFVPGQGGTVQADPVLGSRLLLPRSFSRVGFTPGVPGFGNPLNANNTQQSLPQPFTQAGLVPGRGNNFIGGRNTSPLPVISNILNFTDPGTLTSDLPGSFAGNPTLQPAFNVFGSFLDNIQVDFLIRATQADSRTTLLTAPRLVLFNGQRAWVAVVNQQSFVSSLQPVVDATGQAPLISTIETGAVLDAQATVTADRRYVTMTLRPSVGRLLGIQTFGFSVGPAAGSGLFVQLPSISRTVMRTTVSVPDGGTLLIGGQKLAGEIEIESGVPVLSKIPVLKRFYSSRSHIKDEQVLLVLIKPKIIIQTEAEQEAFPSFSSR